jgi:hypothetical protein
MEQVLEIAQEGSSGGRSFHDGLAASPGESPDRDSGGYCSSALMPEAPHSFPARSPHTSR